MCHLNCAGSVACGVFFTESNVSAIHADLVERVPLRQNFCFVSFEVGFHRLQSRPVALLLVKLEYFLVQFKPAFLTR